MDYWKYLQDIVQWIEGRPGDGLTLQAIAQRGHCSEYHFSRLFRKHCGLSVMAYVRKRSLVLAVNDLYGAESIVEIAGKYGYETASAFARAFRRAFGRSPTDYRAMIEEARRRQGTAKMEVKNVQDEQTLRRVYDFGDLIHNYTSRSHTYLKWEFWKELLRRNPGFLLYMEEAGKIVGAVCGWVEPNNNVTVCMAAVDEAHRRRGIGKTLMEELVRRVKAAGHPIIALGAERGSEGFYIKCGFSPTLFLQSKKHTLSELRAVNDRYEELWALESDANGWARLMLKTPVIDEDMRSRYDRLFEDCIPQTVFLMNL